jgi:hypothetical protein
MKRQSKKPWITCYDNSNEIAEQKTFKTYAELKKELKRYVLKHGNAHVTRTRRGEWGQWFEIWKMEDDKLVKVEQTWL